MKKLTVAKTFEKKVSQNNNTYEIVKFSHWINASESSMIRNTGKGGTLESQEPI